MAQKNNDVNNSIDISIVIVNYNVKEFVANLLESLEKAQKTFRIERFVVDNASSDGSSAYLKKRYPDVKYILNDENVGFGKANNQAIQMAKGKYTLLINPDTIVSQDTLEVMYQHMEKHPETAAAGCKILNPDGTFAPESRRIVPTPMTALWKILGFTRLFPNNPRFSAYYMGGEDEDTAGRVPVLSGSFMFFRTSALQKLKGFDEQFFMYGEDIDLCYRVRKEGGEIDYVPDTSIIHYKGESTKKENLDYVVTFNKAIFQFFRKHYGFGYTLFFRIFILSGIILKGFFSYTKTVLKKLFHPATDLFILNILIILFFIWRYDISPADIPGHYHLRYLSINILLSLIYLGSAIYFDLYGKNRYSIPSVIKSTTLAFTGVVVITFFLRELAFSRLILLLSAISSLLILVGIRLYQMNRTRKTLHLPGRFIERKILLIGLNEKSSDLIRKLRSRAGWNYHIAGLVAQEEDYHLDEIEKVPVLGSLHSISNLVEYHKPDEILFILPAVDHDQILKTISELRGTSVYPRIVPDSLDYIVGKTNVEYLDDIPVVDVGLPYFTPWNLFIKRVFDFGLALAAVTVLTPFLLLPVLVSLNKRKKQTIFLSPSKSFGISLFLPYHENRWKNRYVLFWYVLKGYLSLVGRPIVHEKKPAIANVKPGLTGFLQLSQERLHHEKERQMHESYYLQNYSIWMDIDVLFKTLLYRRPTLENLDTRE